MAVGSHIEWTEATWNPVTGCEEISPGCAHCYARVLALRLLAMGQANYANGFDLTLQPHMLEKPLAWRKPLRIFVNSMSDLFHKDVPEEYIKQVFDVMRRAHWHQFQVLTKRADRLAELSQALEWPENVWMGVSVESAPYASRVDHLRGTGARVKFLSCEPLLGPLAGLNLQGIDWVIVGGESGLHLHDARVAARRALVGRDGPNHWTPDDAKSAWVRDIREQCRVAGVAFFFKQWGGPVKKRTGRELDGRTWDEYPDTVPEAQEVRAGPAAPRSACTRS